MPVYEYACEDCRAQFEMLRPMSQADSPVSCEQCGGGRTRRKQSVCYASSGGKPLAGSTAKSCGGCSGGSCAGCGH